MGLVARRAPFITGSLRRQSVGPLTSSGTGTAQDPTLFPEPGVTRAPGVGRRRRCVPSVGVGPRLSGRGVLALFRHR